MKGFGILSLLITVGVIGWLTVKQLKPQGESSKSTAELAIHSTKRMQGKVQMASVQSAIRSFKAMEGRLPQSLEELEKLNYMDRVPSGVEYDPATGELWLKNN